MNKTLDAQIERAERAAAIGGGSSDAKREGWDDATSDPEDFPLGPACNPLGDGTCESCQ